MTIQTTPGPLANNPGVSVGMSGGGGGGGGGGGMAAGGYGGMIMKGAQIAAKAYGDRANRRFQERLGALNSLNDYKLFLAKMLADDPAKFIKQALKGQTAKNFYAKGKTIYGKGSKPVSSMSQLDPGMQSLLGAMGDVSTYGLSPKEGGGFNWTAPTFSPVVSEKYKKHLGGIASGGTTQQFGGASAGDPGGVGGVGKATAVNTGIPAAGFTKKFGVGA